MSRPILCLDFDGVIHAYTSPWTDATTISDGMTPGFLDWACRAAEHFQLVVYSSRCKEPGAIDAMQAWFAEQVAKAAPGVPGAPLEFGIEFAHEKPAAFLTIDDRCVVFNGRWDAVHLDPQVLRMFLPWNRRQ